MLINKIQIFYKSLVVYDLSRIIEFIPNFSGFMINAPLLDYEMAFSVLRFRLNSTSVNLEISKKIKILKYLL